MAAPLSREDFEAICLIVCPHCASGDRAQFRASTREWVHSTHRVTRMGGSFSHGICWAHGLRNSLFAPPPEREPPGRPEPDPPRDAA